MLFGELKENSSVALLSSTCYHYYHQILCIDLIHSHTMRVRISSNLVQGFPIPSDKGGGEDLEIFYSQLLNEYNS